jgi:uncharacterized protein
VLVLPPAPAARINDYAGVLNPAARAELEASAAAQERRTGHQVAVAVFRSLEGEDLEDVSIRLAQQWRLGRRGLDDGAILLVFVDDRRLRIEVGYGLEDRLTDAMADAIIRNEIAPRFREGRYAEGLEAGLAAIFRVIAGEASPARPTAGGPDWLVLGAVGLIALILVGAMASQVRRRHVHRRGYTAGPDGWHYGPVGVGGFPGRRGWGGGGIAGGGGFRGGGGGFGGGGASGRW